MVLITIQRNGVTLDATLAHPDQLAAETAKLTHGWRLRTGLTLWEAGANLAFDKAD